MIAETRSCICSAGSKTSSPSAWCGWGGGASARCKRPPPATLRWRGGLRLPAGAPDAEKALAVIEDGGEFVAVGEQHAAVDARAIGQTDESGKLAPRQRRASGAELDLKGVELAEQGLQHAIHALILLGEAKILENVERHRAMRPNLRGIVRALRGEVGFGKNFQGIARELFPPAARRCAFRVRQRISSPRTNRFVGAPSLLDEAASTRRQFIAGTGGLEGRGRDSWRADVVGQRQCI